ncbi:pirin family protein [Photobacterium sp. DA100]|uniref:pirin family protein n=1 Tax=Photobacterium sp. DA100 TaxID=3027472 RepID=UPI00247A30F9|nr:pirin family protein [Photobacterium sp. DA100]WEM43446.1 pirin family protein [Photobacterium sp. DA100]
MKKTRTVQKIRFGKKRGLQTTFINPSELEQLNPFVQWDHYTAKALIHAKRLDYQGHSGVDAVSYPVIGQLSHHDSTGSHVTLASGDVHIMTSGEGVIHKEIMTPQNGQIESFSLGTVLPAGKIEMAPASCLYLHAQQLPLIEEHDSTTKVIIGSYKDVSSPAAYSIPMTFLDIMITPYGCWYFETDPEQLAGFVYLRSGSVYISGNQLHRHQMATLNPSPLPIEIRTSRLGARIFIATGKPQLQPLLSSHHSVHSSPQNMSKAIRHIDHLLTARK